MYQSMGWSRADCAQFLHVCERTLHNWERGKHDVPYAAFRLLRITCGMALPGQAWRGWSLRGGKLWTPEGIGIDPQTAFWWALLVRRAETGSKALRALHEAKARPSAGCQYRAVECGASVLGMGATPIQQKYRFLIPTVPTPMVITGRTEQNSIPSLGQGGRQ
ncbi:MAG: VC1465 family Xer recombination activation factor [Comamonadaceae bacterium]|nr:VC1465 family Xer recombination activation factor [Comamonadaceae bacterium]